MNKLIKLPLFLGVVGGLCGGLLAATNLITGPKIKAGEEARVAAAYKTHFDNIQKSVNVDVSENLASAGVLEIIDAYSASEASDASYIGTIYKASVTGFSPGLVFTVSFSNGNVNKIVSISDNETPGLGKDVIANFEKGSQFSVDDMGQFAITGSTKTYNGLEKCIRTCYQDYQAKGGK